MTVSSVHWGMERFSFPTVQVVFDDLFIGIGDVFDKSCTNGFGGGNEYVHVDCSNETGNDVDCFGQYNKAKKVRKLHLSKGSIGTRGLIRDSYLDVSCGNESEFCEENFCAEFRAGGFSVRGDDLKVILVWTCAYKGIYSHSK